MTYEDLDDFTRAYIECALWSSTDESNESGGDPLDDNYSPYDLHSSALERMAKDCADFQESQAALLDRAYQAALLDRAYDGRYDAARAGHDFWLTRNHHGVGFWDRGLGNVGDKLTDAAHAYGNAYLTVGDGKIHHD